MNSLRIVVALLTLSIPAFAQGYGQSAYDNLAQARAALDQSDSVQRPNRTVKRVEKQLSQALSNLALVKNNRGTSLPNAKKAIEAAQAEIAKGYNEEVRTKTLAFVEEAMKQALKAINVKR